VAAPRWRAPLRLKTERIQLRSDASKEIAGEVLKEADEFLSEIEDWLETGDDKTVHIYLFKSYKKFQKTMHAKGEGITYYGCSEPVVAIPHWPMELDDYSGSFVASILETVGSDWRFRLRHELIHVVFREAEGLDRDWLWEGAADYFAHGGHLGDGMKAQRFLSLKKAFLKGQLHSFTRLRTLPINASRGEADLLYAEAWSVIYTLMNLCGPGMRSRIGEWLRAGAPGTLEEALEGSDWTVAKLDQARLSFINQFQCFIEARPLHPGHSAYEMGMREGDCLLQVEGLAVYRIDNRKDLGMYLSFLFHLPMSLEKLGFVRCLVLRGEQIRALALPAGVLKSIRWRLTARAWESLGLRGVSLTKTAPVRLLTSTGG
jgi:hypothetical protein